MTKLCFKNVFFLMQKRFFASTPVGIGVPSSSCSFTVEYLVSSCGLPLKSAISIASSQRLQLKEEKIQRYDSVLNLFRSYGFDQTHIGAVLEKTPLLLSDYKADENLRPKLEYMALYGFSGSHLHNLIVSDPNILKGSLSRAIKPSLEFLRSFLGTDESVLSAVMRKPKLLKNDLRGKLQPNIDCLVKEGVPLDHLIKFFTTYPYHMTTSVHRLVPALKTVKHQLCIDPSARMFLLAVTRISSLGAPLWEKKTQVLKSFGFSQEQVLCIIRRFPNCLSNSEETLRTKLEFYLSTVKLKLDELVSYPNMLGAAIDTRSRPRHNVLKLLLSKKLLEEDAKLARVFTLSEDRFLNKYITNYVQQVPSLMEMYNNDKLAKKIVTSSQAEASI